MFDSHSQLVSTINQSIESDKERKIDNAFQLLFQFHSLWNLFLHKYKQKIPTSSLAHVEELVSAAIKRHEQSESALTELESLKRELDKIHAHFENEARNDKKIANETA
jgi:hypothetical protein